MQVVLDEGYITNVAVRPDCRRKGIAGKLLQVFLDLHRVITWRF
ncbi:MAG: GNAT family N-acetyltransferase [Oscillospiraceae bacterium]